MSGQIKVINNIHAKRFEAELEGGTAIIIYRYYKNDLAFIHTDIPEALRGKGIGSAMAEAALQFAVAEKKKIMLFCPFVAKYVKQHPEYHHLVDPEFHPAYKTALVYNH